MKNKHYVFVVDDDNSARIGLQRLLLAAGYNALGFASTKEFLDYIDPNVTGCIVLDIRMPGMTGEELLSSLKEHRLYLPTIVVSGNDDATTKKRAKLMKAVGFFRKPVDGTALLDAIEWALKSGNMEKYDK